MRSPRTRTIQLLSVLVAGASLSPLGACGGKTNDANDGASSGSPGTNGKGSSSSGPDGTSPGEPAQPSDCGPLRNATLKIDPLLCEPQLEGTTSYDPNSRCGAHVCSWSVTLPCQTGSDGGGADADGGSESSLTEHERACKLCNAAAPGNAVRSNLCTVRPSDGGGAVIVSCGACGVGRPPKAFVAKETSGSSDAAAWLARMAQLEAASVHAFRALHDDLARLGAPRSLLRDLRTAGDDEVRHARLVARQAERLGAIVPKVGVLESRPRSLEVVAIENVQEGCVNETFGAVIAAMQAEHASDPRIKRMMNGIARDELRHAALSWRIAEWILGRLDAGARARVDAARRGALASLEAELAKGGEGLPSLGLPDAARARAALAAIRPALASGDLRQAA